MISVNSHDPQDMTAEAGGNTRSGRDRVSTSRATSQKPIRSRVACQECNHRKVRCDVTRTGIPCSNCSRDAATCQVLPRKKHRPRRTGAQHDRELPHETAAAGPASRDRSLGGQNIQALQDDESRERHSLRTSSQLPHTPNGQRQSCLKENAGSVPSNRSKAFVDPLDADLPDDNSLSYIGDRRGARSFVYELCHPGAPQDARPSLPPRTPAIQWKPHEMEYLSHEGVFSNLPDDVCDDLIRCYFHHVHFFLPIVDASSFLNEYISHGRQNISLLLFWSMLLAAANYVEADTLRRAGFASRKAMKTAMYARTKCLYDFDRGTDKVTLIQSVILMGFWYTDPQDHTGAWYWIGIAITLSQTLGLHRRPQSNHRGQRLSKAWQPLVRRIWWTCLVRDRWLSLAKGRPMRICQDDCDIYKPVLQDITGDLENISNQAREKFIPTDAEMLARMWISLVDICTTLGSILRIHYRANGPKPLVSDIDNCAEQLRSCREQQEMLSDDTSDLLRLHNYQLELFYEATVIVLYRPYVLNGPATLHGEAQALWKTVALNRARAAASNTNIVLEKIIELDSVHLLKPMIITAVIPAMQIHLFDCKSDQPLRRGLGSNKLNLCMLVLSRLRETYWSASVIHRLFERAQAILADSHLDVSETSGGSQNVAETTDQYRQEYQQQQHQCHRQHENHRTDEEEEEEEEEEAMSAPSPPTHDSLATAHMTTTTTTTTTSEQVDPSWLNNGSFYFSTVDQLLSPGFSLSESGFPSVVSMGYNDDMLRAYDQIMPMSSDPSLGIVYNV